jgi:hypothetical protein
MQKAYMMRHRGDRTLPTVCEQIGCRRWRKGWATAVDVSTELGRRQAAHIRCGGTRRDYTELTGTVREQIVGRDAPVELVVFRFEPGQRCFEEHKTRPTLYVVRDLGQFRRHRRPADWVEDFAEHQDKLALIVARG